MLRGRSAQPILDDASGAAEVLRGARIAVITGAGISTDSGIPDYRGSAAVPQSRIDFQAFATQHEVRQRYWLRGHLGLRRFSLAEPNAGHLALVAMEQNGLLSGVVTQNVDGLHRKAGSSRVVELHGNISRLVCLSCAQSFSRLRFDESFAEMNPWIDEPLRARSGALTEEEFYTPELTRNVRVPSCTVCSGVLKPDVVFFGEFVPGAIFGHAQDVITQADSLLVVGSSLVVNSAVRLVELARKRRMPIVIVNRGETRSDRWATVRVEGGSTEVLTSLARTLGATDIHQDIE